MASSSSVLGWLLGKAAAAKKPPYTYLLRLIDVATNISPTFNSLLRGGGDTGILKSSSIFSSSLPWLMLPPDFKRKSVVAYTFESPALGKLKFYRKREGILAEAEKNIDFVSSSHGWLALFNHRTCNLYLLNPLSGRQIKLPPIRNLPGLPTSNLYIRTQLVTKVITSCSPEEKDDCRVMMSYGRDRRLAFCSLTTDAEWTCIGDLRGHNIQDPRCYDDFVYSSRHKLFYCTTVYDDFEAWNLHWTSLRTPVFKMDSAPLEMKDHQLAPEIKDELNYADTPQAIDGIKYPWNARTREELKLKMSSTSMVFLIVAEESGDIYWVRRHIIPYMDMFGSLVNIHSVKPSTARQHPYKTVAFDVHKYDTENRKFNLMDKGCLDGLAFFIGNNNSFAISPTSSSNEFTKLKPNSIYFTDINPFIPPSWRNLKFGGHDIGIYNYEDGSFSECCGFPVEREGIRRIIPPPMWFT